MKLDARDGELGQYGNYVDYLPEADDAATFRKAMIKLLKEDFRKTCKLTKLRARRGSFKIIWGPPRMLFPEDGPAPYMAASAAWKADLIR